MFNKEKRTTEIRVRFTPEEKERLKKIAESKNMSISEYIRYCLDNENRRNK